MRIEAIAKELAALRAIIKCIEEHNLQSEYLPYGLEKCIAQLEKQKADKEATSSDNAKDPATPMNSPLSMGMELLLVRKSLKEKLKVHRTRHIAFHVARVTAYWDDIGLAASIVVQARDLWQWMNWSICVCIKTTYIYRRCSCSWFCLTAVLKTLQFCLCLCLQFLQSHYVDWEGGQ